MKLKLTDRLWKLTDPELDGGSNIDDVEFIFTMFVQYAFEFLRNDSAPTPPTNKGPIPVRLCDVQHRRLRVRSVPNPAHDHTTVRSLYPECYRFSRLLYRMLRMLVIWGLV